MASLPFDTILSCDTDWQEEQLVETLYLVQGLMFSPPIGPIHSSHLACQGIITLLARRSFLCVLTNLESLPPEHFWLKYICKIRKLWLYLLRIMWHEIFTVVNPIQDSTSKILLLFVERKLWCLLICLSGSCQAGSCYIRHVMSIIIVHSYHNFHYYKSYSLGHFQVGEPYQPKKNKKKICQQYCAISHTQLCF